MSNRRNSLAYAVMTVLTGTGFAAVTPGVALAQEPGTEDAPQVSPLPLERRKLHVHVDWTGDR